VQDGFSATRAWWPLPARPIPGAALLLGLVADPAPGAVLVLPLDIDADVAGQVVAGATLHGRAVTTRIRRMDRRGDPRPRALHPPGSPRPTPPLSTDSHSHHWHMRVQPQTDIQQGQDVARSDSPPYCVPRHPGYLDSS